MQSSLNFSTTTHSKASRSVGSRRALPPRVAGRPTVASRASKGEASPVATIQKYLLVPSVVAIADPAFAEEAQLAQDVTDAAKEVVEAAPAEEASKVPQYLLLFLPLILYSLFTAYRSFDREAKIEDFVFYTVGAVVVGNLVSIIFFKTRLF
ncbi:hypothetical protein HKI87_14g76410 [Chloropicon roscoffensis]|uniref:Uncharacterized protein n=1 Tax=Chloropicon roscoffensis TaxID=1461544 RepID=A0AAX4PJ43_9CHLO